MRKNNSNPYRSFGQHGRKRFGKYPDYSGQTRLAWICLIMMVSCLIAATVLSAIDDSETDETEIELVEG
jgi:hypothetical protein